MPNSTPFRVLHVPPIPSNRNVNATPPNAYLSHYRVLHISPSRNPGETQIANEMASFFTMIQVYEYYISHHLAKSFESLFGSVTCLPGCFCMYRLKTPGKKPVPLLIQDDIIEEYDENNVDTLHKKNLFSLGEDRYLTTLMLKQFPEYRTKFAPDATCRTIVPDSLSVLLSQRRRWYALLYDAVNDFYRINSTVHNLWEVCFVGVFFV